MSQGKVVVIAISKRASTVSITVPGELTIDVGPAGHLSVTSPKTLVVDSSGRIVKIKPATLNDPRGTLAAGERSVAIGGNRGRTQATGNRSVSVGGDNFGIISTGDGARIIQHQGDRSGQNVISTGDDATIVTSANAPAAKASASGSGTILTVPPETIVIVHEADPVRCTPEATNAKIEFERI